MFAGATNNPFIVATEVCSALAVCLFWLIPNKIKLTQRQTQKAINKVLIFKLKSFINHILPYKNAFVIIYIKVFNFSYMRFITIFFPLY
jgi:hypothetical protein